MKLTAVLGLLLLVFGSGCRRNAEGAEKPAPAHATAPDVVTLSPGALRAAGVETAVAEYRSANREISTTGTVQPDQHRIQQVTSLAGGRVERVAVSIGQTVTADAVLAVIASPEIADMKGRLLEAEARLGVSRAAAERSRRLAQIGAAPGKDVQTATADLAAAEAEVSHLRGALRSFGGSEGQSGIATVVLRAPISGVVTERLINPGAGIQAGQSLFTIVDPRLVWVIADVSAADLSSVAIGSQAVIRAPTSTTPLTGTVEYIDPSIRPETRTTAVRITVNNPANLLRVGMFVDVRLRTASATQPAVWVPASAIENIGERTIVFVPIAGASGSFRVKDVQPGETIGAFRSVLSGVTAGERVVSKGTFALKSQMLKSQFEED